jgi:two-component system sensor histidine kinase QseC
VRSIRSRLLVVLLGSTGLVWFLAVVWIYFGTQAEVERVLDARLMEAARMVDSLLTDRRVDLALASIDSGATVPQSLSIEPQSYERQLSCQIWSLDGTLVGQSEHAPEGRLTDVKQGFSETEVGGETWRVFAIENEVLGVRVMVGDSIRIRDRLVNDVIKGLVAPAALVLPFLGGAIWLSVRRGMSPLKDMEHALAVRDANDLHPLPETQLPKEIAPAVEALNGLFRRVADARDREKSFTAFAAHELKTPLAGLKTQAQIALASGDGEVHAHALRQISSGVDRTSRLVRQLLDLAAVEGDAEQPSAAAVRPSELVARISGNLSLPSAPSIEVAYDGLDADRTLRLDPVLTTLALRNLIENAIVYSPHGAKIIIRLSARNGRLHLCVEDEEPGIAVDELSRATDRFFRGRHRSSEGSGLGLAIAKEAVARMGGGLSLENREPHGLRAVISVPVEELQ